jgi:hypothetical protein
VTNTALLWILLTSVGPAQRAVQHRLNPLPPKCPELSTQNIWRFTHKRLAFKPDRMIGIDASDAYSRRPLSRASRPFKGPILMGRKGSIWRVPRAIGERPVFAHCCRPLRRFQMAEMPPRRAASALVCRNLAIGQPLNVGLDRYHGRPCSNRWRGLLAGAANLIAATPSTHRDAAFVHRRATPKPVIWETGWDGRLYDDEGKAW